MDTLCDPDETKIFIRGLRRHTDMQTLSREAEGKDSTEGNFTASAKGTILPAPYNVSCRPNGGQTLVGRLRNWDMHSKRRN